MGDCVPLPGTKGEGEGREGREGWVERDRGERVRGKVGRGERGEGGRE